MALNPAAVIFLLFFPNYTDSKTKGVVYLDDFTFNKIICHHHKVCIVKFDKQYSYGQLEDEFQKFALKAAPVDGIIVTELGTTDWGEKENHATRQKYSVSTNDYPHFKLFYRGNRSSPISYNDEITDEKLVQWVNENGDIHIDTESPSDKFEQMADQFIQAVHNNDATRKSKLLSDLEEMLQEQLSENIKLSGQLYWKIMKKISSEGITYISSEMKRLPKLLKEKLHGDKKILLEKKLEILRIFNKLI